MSWRIGLVVLCVCLQFTWISAEDASSNAEVCAAGHAACVGRGKSMMQMSSSHAVARSQKPHKPHNRHKLELGLDDINQIKAKFMSPVGEVKLRAKSSAASASGGQCFHGQAWLDNFLKEPSWSNYSQGDQDAVLFSLFSSVNLGTTNKNYVEFGFPEKFINSSYGNGHGLHDNLGFTPALLLDGQVSTQEINLHEAMISAKNIVELFDQYQVPLEVDYVSVDIDSCELWVFYALAEKYRPRVVTMEYNSNYHLDNHTTMRCSDPMFGREPGAIGTYVWGGDNVYGASLSALELAARTRGYSLVYVTPYLDAFFVRSDLMCKGSAVSKEVFRAATSLPMFGPYNGEYGSAADVTTDFAAWLRVHS